MQDEKIEKSFAFYIPVELVKSDKKDGGSDEDGEWRIQGIASTDDVDLQGEKVLQEGLDISVLKAGRGLFNVDHKTGPENVIGQIDDADFVNVNGKSSLFVKGYLFKAQPRAQAYYNIMKSLRRDSQPRVHFSIEGKVTNRDMMETSIIKGARIEKVALTLDPVNPNTFVDLVKSLQAIEPEEQGSSLDLTVDELKVRLQDAVDGVLKALSAGAGYTKAPAERTGGEAVSTESLEGSPKLTFSKFKKKVKNPKKLLKAIIELACRHYPEHDRLDVARIITNRFIENLKEQ